MSCEQKRYHQGQTTSSLQIKLLCLKSWTRSTKPLTPQRTLGRAFQYIPVGCFSDDRPHCGSKHQNEQTSRKVSILCTHTNRVTGKTKAKSFLDDNSSSNNNKIKRFNPSSTASNDCSKNMQ